MDIQDIFIPSPPPHNRQHSNGYPYTGAFEYIFVCTCVHVCVCMRVHVCVRHMCVFLWMCAHACGCLSPCEHVSKVRLTSAIFFSYPSLASFWRGDLPEKLFIFFFWALNSERHAC